MNLDAAISLLRQEAGKALDPAAVQPFLEIYPGLAEEIAFHAPNRRPGESTPIVPRLIKGLLDCSSLAARSDETPLRPNGWFKTERPLERLDAEGSGHEIEPQTSDHLVRARRECGDGERTAGV